MNTRIAMVCVLFIALANAAVAQWSQGPTNQSPSMYDQSYRGPMNMYAQPVFSVGPGQANQRAQQAPEGVFPMAASGLQSLGGYLWSYMPAPVRGVESPYQVAPGAGHVSVQFVPGSN